MMMMMMMIMFTLMFHLEQTTVNNTAGFSEGKFHLERDNIAFGRLQEIYFILVSTVKKY